MRCSTAASVVALAALAAAQTPPGSQPATGNLLTVKYGSTAVVPNAMEPMPLVQTQPSISSSRQLSGTHMILMMDLTLPLSSVSMIPPDKIVPGLQPNRTTRCHWLQTDLTQAANGSFVSDSKAISLYGGPTPPPGDIPHDYVFYLFRQPDNFTLPPPDAGRDLFATDAPDRVDFSAVAIADVVGAPVAANFMRVVSDQPANSTSPGTAAPSGTAPPSSGSGVPRPSGTGAPSSSPSGTGGAGGPGGPSLSVTPTPTPTPNPSGSVPPSSGARANAAVGLGAGSLIFGAGVMMMML